MPNARIELLEKFLKQNDGRLSRRARANEFAALTSEEVAQVEQLYRDSFGVEQ